MSSKNGRKQNEKAQKAKNREEKGSVNDFIGLLIPAPFFFEGYASENYHWRENPKRCRVIKEKIPSNLTVARYLFPLCRVDISHHIEATSTHLEKRGETGGLCLYICLRFPAVSLDFIGSWNKDFARIHLHRKEKNDN